MDDWRARGPVENEKARSAICALQSPICGSGRDAEEEWTRSLAFWAENELLHGNDEALIDRAMPEFEKTLIRAALNKAKGHRQEAAKLLGWGRNTLTRKMRLLEME